MQLWCWLLLLSKGNSTSITVFNYCWKSISNSKLKCFLFITWITILYFLTVLVFNQCNNDFLFLFPLTPPARREVRRAKGHPFGSVLQYHRRRHGGFSQRMPQAAEAVPAGEQTGQLQAHICSLSFFTASFGPRKLLPYLASRHWAVFHINCGSIQCLLQTVHHVCELLRSARDLYWPLDVTVTVVFATRWYRTFSVSVEQLREFSCCTSVLSSHSALQWEIRLFDVCQWLKTTCQLTTGTTSAIVLMSEQKENSIGNSEILRLSCIIPLTVNLKVLVRNWNSVGALTPSVLEAHFHSWTDDEASGKLVKFVWIC